VEQSACVLALLVAQYVCLSPKPSHPLPKQKISGAGGTVSDQDYQCV